MPPPEAPKVTRPAKRRVRTDPAPGQRDEPPSPELTPEDPSQVDSRSDRLKADKPPHY